ncbi:unnamed protein product [Coregonus sp. 'balchen']|nr:unnamed protein product [Coregonus sp. 'balchen']
MAVSSENAAIENMERRLEKQQLDGIMVEAEVLVDSDGALSKLGESEWKTVVRALFEKVLEEAVYNEVNKTLTAINEQDKLRWWKNTHRPGMPTD